MKIFSTICEENVLKEKEREPFLRLHSPLGLHEYFRSFIGCWDYVYMRLDIVSADLVRGRCVSNDGPA